MASRLEEIIDEIEEYMENCKSQPMSKGKILVEKDVMNDLLTELRMKAPEEVKRYQKIIANKDAILADAQQRADEIVAAAQVQTNELVSEHQIMQQAYAQANEVVSIATNQAQEILDKATEDANEIRASAIEYTDALLAEMENITSNIIEATNESYGSLLSTMQGYYNVLHANRTQLVPPETLDNRKPSAEGTAGNNGAGPDVI